MLEDRIEVPEPKQNIFNVASPSVMDDCDLFNYILNDGKGGVFAISSMDLDFEV